MNALLKVRAAFARAVFLVVIFPFIAYAWCYAKATGQPTGLDFE